MSWAFTSKTIRERAGLAAERPLSPREALEDYRVRGYASVAMQSFHVVPGQMDAEIRRLEVPGLRIAHGAPLLSSERDRDKVERLLEADFHSFWPSVVVTHGNHRYPEYNRPLIELARSLEARHSRVFVCSVEGEPGTARLSDASVLAAVSGGVRFVPLMLVAGEHIAQDVMGQHPESWSSLIGASQAEVTLSLGQRPEALDLFFEHAEAAMTQLSAPGDRPPAHVR